MSEEELEKLASKRAEEETETVDDCDYDGCSRSCARDYYYFGFKDGFNKAIEKLKQVFTNYENSYRERICYCDLFQFLKKNLSEALINEQ